MKTKTLLQINITANWGSTGKIAEQIGLCAMAHGWKSYIAYGRWCNLSKSHLIKVGNKLDMYMHYGEQRIRDNEGLCSRRATKRLIRFICVINPDVVQLHNIHDHYLNYRLLFEYLNKTDIKVVWTFHDCWAFTGHCYHFVQERCDKWKTECFECIKRNNFIDRSRQNFLLKKSLFLNNRNLTIIPVSQWMGDLVKESFFKNKRFQVIRNGVDLKTFVPICAKTSDKDGRFKIIAISNVWLPYKGEFDIYKLRSMLPEDEYDITMVGLSKEQVKNLPAGIRGIRRTQNVQELVQLYSESNVLINPTYADTFPTVNIEALACGTPVITYKTGGSPEAVDEKTGVVIEQGNIEALADAIRKMKAQPLSPDDCRQRAIDCFDKNKCFENYIKLYDSLIEQK